MFSRTLVGKNLSGVLVTRLSTDDITGSILGIMIFDASPKIDLPSKLSFNSSIFAVHEEIVPIEELRSLLLVVWRKESSISGASVLMDEGKCMNNISETYCFHMDMISLTLLLNALTICTVLKITSKSFSGLIVILFILIINSLFMLLRKLRRLLILSS